MRSAPPVGADRGGPGPNFWRLWSASAISNLGDGVRLTALPLLASTITRDPLLVAGVFTAGFLPWTLFSIVAGALVDRWDRRTVMVRANAFRTVVVAVLGAAVLLRLENLPLVYAIAFLLGVAETLYDNAAQAFLPSLVRRDALELANGRLQAAEIVMNGFVGPPVGSFLFAAAAGLPFLVDSGTFAVSAALIFSIAAVGRPVRDTAVPSRLRSEIAEGITWLWRHRLLRTLAIMLGVINLLSLAVDGILVLFALEILKVSEAGFGLLISVGAVGSVAGGLLGARVSRAVGQGTALMLLVLSSAVVYAITGLSSDPILVGGMFALVGFFGIVWNVITVSLRQTIVPDRLLGRVNSAYRAIGWGSIPLGGLLGGVLARTFGLRAPFIAAAVIMAVAGVAVLPVINNRTIAAAKLEALGDDV